MQHDKKITAVLLFFIALPNLQAGSFPYSTIFTTKEASPNEVLAAKEVRRYVYLCTKTLLPICSTGPNFHPEKDAILIANSKAISGIINELKEDSSFGNFASDEYSLKNIGLNDHNILLLLGGSSQSTLYAAFTFVEKFGVRFYLHGDVIPNSIDNNATLTRLDEFHSPLFPIRGVLPFHDFPEGPDWWNLEDYYAILEQLPKLRMNFFALHCYPEGGPNAEPTVWHGLERDLSDSGNFKFSYPASYSSTIRGNWGYDSMLTSSYHCGADQLFEKDIYCAEIMDDNCPYPQNRSASNTVFQKSYEQLRRVFEFAKSVGIQTCVGTNTPLIIPSDLYSHLDSLGKKPERLQTSIELYMGTFRAIHKHYPIDYYWLWTPESWTWVGTEKEQIPSTIVDIYAALTAIQNSYPDCQLATCGWVLGPEWDRSLFEKILPQQITLSCINRHAGMSSLDPAFRDIKNHPSWAIPWLEDDAALVSPQLWVGRLRRDAQDALRYGCDGLIGIHWRTRILGPNIAALSRAAWKQSPWSLMDTPSGSTDGVIKTTPHPIENTENDILYQSQIAGTPQYRLAIPNGKYTVILHFCEYQCDQPGQRTFHINLQGKQVLNELDIFKIAGRFTALSYSFDNILVEDRQLQIDLIQLKNYTCISGIEIVGKEKNVRLNCGGPDDSNFKSDTQPDAARYSAVDDFYADWTIRQFGEANADNIAQLFNKIDGHLPRPSQWVKGPGGIVPDPRDWDEVSREYEFVTQFESFRSGVRGKGNLQRFDYWQAHFRNMRINAKINCLWAQFNSAMDSTKQVKDEKQRRLYAEATVLPIYTEIISSIEALYQTMLAFVSTNAELGTIMNWEQHIFPHLLNETGAELQRAWGHPLPAEAQLSTRYTGPSRIIVPSSRSSVRRGENLQLKIHYLGQKPPVDFKLYWRQLGKGRFKSFPITHVNRGVFSARISNIKSDIEYYIIFETQDLQKLCFPYNYPKHTQTIVVLDP